MASGSNLGTLRRDNLSTVLIELHTRNEMKRSELGHLTGLRRSTIGELVTDLKNRGLVSGSLGAADGVPGRPSHAVCPRWEGAVALALEIAVDTVAVAAVGLGGEIRHLKRVPREPGRGSIDQTLDDLAALARPVITKLADANLVGIGVSYFGVVGAEGNVARFAPNIGWHDLDINAEIHKRLPIPPGMSVEAANDADCAALATFLRGPVSPISNLIYVSGEVGVGAGIILDGRPLSGTSGFAGEAGHMKVNPNGKPCQCGGSGCWETEIGEMAIINAAHDSGRKSGPSSISQVIEIAAKDPASASGEALRQASHWIGLGLANLVNLLNPEYIFLGGILGEILADQRPDIMASLEANAMESSLADVTLQVDPNRWTSLAGAGEMVLMTILEDPRLVRPLAEDNSVR